MKKNTIILDANEAVARVAYSLNEVIAIYPITPASPMGEWADAWAEAGRKNLWGSVPHVIELQSEGGAAGTVHGALQNGALTTTFTASQGLLLMIPNMYKIAGELTPMVIHVAARSLATHALSIFCDHSDVMSTRMTGFAMLCSNSVQEAMDLALISHAATLETRIPFLHFFDGFRTSHEIAGIEDIPENVLKMMISDARIEELRSRSLSPNHPFIRGTAQNPDVFFQAREACNPWYDACSAKVQATMDRFAQLTGRQYNLFDFYGDPEAEDVIVLMGSGVETARETAEWLIRNGKKAGVLSVRLYRPYSPLDFVKSLPATVKNIAVLDRTKEPGAMGDPLYQDVITAFSEMQGHDENPVKMIPRIISGRYGLSSKEFTPAMVKRIYEELQSEKPAKHFTIGINDDVTSLSLDYDAGWDIEPDEVFRGLFYGLGSDGTVSANKNSIKIIGDNTGFETQGFFVYDSKKSGSVTVSHLRFSKDPIRSAYLIGKAGFIACHQPQFLTMFDMLSKAKDGGVFLLNHSEPAETVWDIIPEPVRMQIRNKNLKFYVIDAEKVARDAGMGNRINTVMQTCFFAISGILPRDQAIQAIKTSIRKSYGKRGEQVIKKNEEAVDQTVDSLFEVIIPGMNGAGPAMPLSPTTGAPDFVQQVTRLIMEGRGDELPVSAMPADGTFPSGTTKWEKRCITNEIPVWESDICIQCGKCAMVCPHGVIRIKAYDEAVLADRPETFKFMDAKGREWPDNTKYTIQVAPEDCTGCELCVEVCPAKDKSEVSRKALNMAAVRPLYETERVNWDFFLGLPETDRDLVKADTVKGSQYLQPLFEFSGACAGCGETPYIKLATQLFGDRMVVANATGCSSIYGGNLPTTPWTVNKEGRGPAWSNSLFEDNAEFGLGYRVAIDKQASQSLELLKSLENTAGRELVESIISNPQTEEADIRRQRLNVELLVEKLKNDGSPAARRLISLADYLVRRSVWIVGGDGWAYDIGYGGLDHVLASGRDVNILILDTEVYSNTGGQMSKATPLGAVAKFAAAGKRQGKKDLGALALTNGNVYVARIAMGASDTQCVKALTEAERFKGPSVIIAYSHCIAHGYDMKYGLHHQKLAVECGHWPLFRYNPDLALQGKNPMQLDSKKPSIPFTEYAYTETRYHMLTKMDPKLARSLMDDAQKAVHKQWKWYEDMVQHYEPVKSEISSGTAPSAAASTDRTASAQTGAFASSSATASVPVQKSGNAPGTTSANVPGSASVNASGPPADVPGPSSGPESKHSHMPSKSSTPSNDQTKG